MPIINRQDASDVEERVARVFGAGSPQERAREIRALFVEKLDFAPTSGEISLANARASVSLPGSAARVATLEGVNVAYVHLDTRRVRKAEAAEAVRLTSNQLDGDLMMVFTNHDASQLHLIYPSFEGIRPTLRRMVIERDLPRRTAVQQLSNIYWRWQEMGSLHAALESAFDVEAVTLKFFAEYKRVFENALDNIEGFGHDDEEQEAKKVFAQTLFNRLMFVYFISRKGWLSFDGDQDYLNALWNDYSAGATPPVSKDDWDVGASNFHVDRLRPLFTALNSYEAHNLTSENVAHRLIGKVPPLNGGLFEPSDSDNCVAIFVPDSVIRSMFDDLFDKFNFTVMESTPFDVEVAVDPEMLGKVFEELVTGRHDSGAYYTPRPVVSFMCREALKGYLQSWAGSLSEDAIRAFVDDRDTSGVSVSDAREIGRALDEVTVVDPACGSGAYLLGMMQELVELQTELYNVVQDSRSLYELKLQIIERNLYGADSDQFAVNIAMLRLWLSLSIEYDAPGDPPTLPNLDFKIVRGDSLLGPDPNPTLQANMFTEAIRQSNLGDLKAEYMRENRPSRKPPLRQRIADAENRLRDITLGGADAPGGSVDWRIRFAEVIGQGGFDIAVANPPYVRQEHIKPDSYKNELAGQYANAVVKRSDLYCYFYARGLELLGDGGMHLFVCSNSWLDVGYGAKLQEYLLKNAHVRAIYESAIERQFSTAQINTIISVIQKTSSDNSSETRFVSLRDQFETALDNPGARREILKTRGELMESGLGARNARGQRKYVGDKWGGKYLRAPDIYHHIIEKYADKLVRLGDIAIVKRGVTTGANDFFYLSHEDAESWGIENEYLCPVMTSPQESRSIAIDPDTLPMWLFMCHADKDDLAYTGALAYIKWGEAQEYHRRSSTRARRRWYDLGQITIPPLAMNKMIDTTSRAFLTMECVFVNNVLYEIHPENTTPAKLCTALNSTICNLIVNPEGRVNFGGGMLELAAYETANLAIVNPILLSEPDTEVFVSVDWDVLTPSAERRQIDDMVFDVLGLTQGERDAVYEGVVELVENRRRRARSV